ncbi:MAG TPA: mechanosensitive ion channel domain-containing protein [Psychromonas sp.]
MILLMSAVLIISYYLSVKFVKGAVEKLGQIKSVSLYRIHYINKTLQIVITVLFVITFFLILGVEYSQLSVFLSSVFAVIGVALFAQWSILSNITASLIIFFFFPYRVGDRIKVVDKDDDISGIVEEITLFHVLIRREDELITYPNSLILQKSVIKNPNIKATTDEVGDKIES